ncbi:MAG TPA: hypothetical protein EYH23_00340 [Euryarchaeota archaeon]|nr:hypothetical protein [Euryarchaeota archaeon]HIQ09957.1 hypothetical protein [Euryarchaeota archaeon]
MILSVVSGKGGVGKTFTSLNLAAVLAEAGDRVLVVDANFTSPTVATHFGVTPDTHTIDEALAKGTYNPMDLVWIHPAGFHFVTPSFNMVALDDQALHTIFEMLRPLYANYDVVILDGPAGVGRDVYYTVMNSDAVLVVANPNYPSLFNALKTHHFAKQLGKMVPGAVLNMYRKGCVPVDEASQILELPILSVIPEDRSVREALQKGELLVKYRPSSPAAKAIYDLAEALTGKSFRRKKSGGLADVLETIKRWLFS